MNHESRPGQAARGEDLIGQDHLHDTASLRHAATLNGHKPTPFKTAVQEYREAGWAGTLPLPPLEKGPPPTGFTGWKGIDPPTKMIELWANKTVGDYQAHSNIAIHLPDGVVGIDVDHYGSKHGGDTLAKLEAELCPLPGTWTSTARPGTVSGIRWYRVEPGMRWPTGPGKDIEFIHRGHRYAVVAPSIHDKTGEPYVWVDYGGVVDHFGIPNPDDLPWMPDEWQIRFTGGELYVEVPDYEPATDAQKSQCLTEGEPCQAVVKAMDKYQDGAKLNARHDSMIAAVHAMVRHGEQGHHGVKEALKVIYGQFASDVAPDRKDGSEVGEFQRAVNGSVAKHLASPTKEEDRGCCGGSKAPEVEAWNPEARPLNLPVSFYESRPELKEIREFAHRWGAPADPVLYAILARVSAALPRSQRVQTGIMSPIGASLNLFVAAIGPSGSCKSSSATIAKSYFTPDVENMIDGVALGSGEGLAEAYMGTVDVDDNSKGKQKTKKERRQVRDNLFIVVDEGEALTKQMDRNGATIGPVLRSAADGKELGQANADEARNRHVGEGKYSLGILMGFQPETVAPLLRDSSSGTTQRFLYCSTTSEDIPDTPPEQTARTWQAGKFASPVEEVRIWNYPGVPMAMTPDIKAEVWRDHLAHMKGQVDEDRLNARKNLTKAKLAALLTLLSDPGRQIVTQEEWDMAEVMWQISCNVRDHYRAKALEQDRKRDDQNDTRAAIRAGKTEIAKMEARDGYVPKAVIRCAKSIAKHVNGGDAKTANDCKQALASRDRHLAEEAIEYAVSVLWIKVDGTSVTPGEAAPK